MVLERIPQGRFLLPGWKKGGATPEQICKAARWSSFATFTRHYRLVLLSSRDQASGEYLGILSGAVLEDDRGNPELDYVTL